MKIYIDGLFYLGGGIGRYYESLVKELCNHGYIIYTCVPARHQSIFLKEFSCCSNIIPIFVNYEKFSLFGMFFQYFVLKKIKDKVQLFFFPHVNIPFFIVHKLVLTVHDIRPFTIYWDRGVLKKILFQMLYRRSIRVSKSIISVSFNTSRQISQFDSRYSHKINVLYEFINDLFFNSKKQHQIIKSKYILFVGSRKYHKNLITLISSFFKIQKFIPHSLVFAGPRDTCRDIDEIDSYIMSHNLYGRFIQHLSPSDIELISLYQHADLFVFPSLFEGFGLPPLEAIASGCPAILSDIPIFREIFGDSALYFPPRSEESLSALMLHLLMNDKDRTDLLLKQTERLKLFDREKIVASYIELFESVAR